MYAAFVVAVHAHPSEGPEGSMLAAHSLNRLEMELPNAMMMPRFRKSDAIEFPGMSMSLVVGGRGGRNSYQSMTHPRLSLAVCVCVRARTRVCVCVCVSGKGYGGGGPRRGLRWRCGPDLCACMWRRGHRGPLTPITS